MRKLVRVETALIMALPVESQKQFERAGIEVHYCGIGKINAAFKATDLLLTQKYKNIVNLGTAGSHKLKPGELVECVGFVERDMDLTAVGFPRGQVPKDPHSGKILIEAMTSYPKGICGTGDHIELREPKLECDLMDMEAYAIAKVCRKLNVRFQAFKYITDSSDENTRKDWNSHLRRASEALLQVFCEITE